MLQSGAKHSGTSWAELLLGFELTTGLDTPSFHRPPSGPAMDAELAEPDDLGVKARAFSRSVKAAERVVGISLLAPSQSARVRSLASSGLAAISGFLGRACFLGKEERVNLLVCTLNH